MDCYILTDEDGVNLRMEEVLPCDRRRLHFPCQINRSFTKEVKMRMTRCDLLMRIVNEFDPGSEARVESHVNVGLLRGETVLRTVDDRTTAVTLAAVLMVKV